MGRRARVTTRSTARLTTWWLVGLVVGALVLGACDSSGSDAPEGVSSERVLFAVDGTASPDGDDLEAAAEILERRLDALGVGDPDATVDGEQIVVTGTGVEEWAENVAATGRFEIRPVETILPPPTPDGAGGPGTERITMEGPDGVVELEALPVRAQDGTGNAEVSYAVSESKLGGDAVRAAKAEFTGGSMGWIVNMRLTDEGVEAFDDLARERVRLSPPRNAIALVVDDEVVSAPAFNEPNYHGDLQVAPFTTEREAQVIAALVADGPLPVPLRVAA